jgi:hypothetical protein
MSNVTVFPAARLGPRGRWWPGKTLLLDREPPEPPRRRANIAAQGKCRAVLQRAGHVVHVGKSGT